MSDSLQPHGLQHTRPPCPSPASIVYSNSCPLSRWYPSHLILCSPLFLLRSIFPSIRVFSNESVLHIGWPKYWSFSISIIPSKEYSGMISFRMDWLDLLAVQRTHKSVHNTTVQKQQFFSAQLSLQSNSHIHTLVWMWKTITMVLTTGKTITMTRQTFVGKAMSAF